MRQRQLRLVVTFHTTAAAVATEALCRRMGDRELICLFNFSNQFVRAGADRPGRYTELMYGTSYDDIRRVELWPNGFAWLLRDTEHPEKEASQ